MKNQVQSQIDRFLALAKTPVAATEHGASSHSRATDSLSKLIKTEEDAAVFMAELNAIFKLAQSK